MRFHEVEMKGKIWIQKVVSVPPWTAADEGRYIYDLATKTTYFGTNTNWAPQYSFQKIEVSGQSNVEAVLPVDTLTLSAGQGMVIKTIAPSKVIGFEADIFPPADKFIFDVFFIAGRKLWIFENVAPVGWSVLIAAGDGLLAVSGGTNAYSVAGGTQSGTWSQPTHNHTSAGHTHNSVAHNHTVPAHVHPATTGNAGIHQHSIPTTVLTVAQIPPHSHDAPTYNGLAGGFECPRDSGGFDYVLAAPTTAVGGGQAHGHGLAGPDGSHNHTATVSFDLGGVTSVSGPSATDNVIPPNTGSSATVNTYRPYANVGIIIVKS